MEKANFKRKSEEPSAAPPMKTAAKARTPNNKEDNRADAGVGTLPGPPEPYMGNWNVPPPDYNPEPWMRRTETGAYEYIPAEELWAEDRDTFGLVEGGDYAYDLEGHLWYYK